MIEWFTDIRTTALVATAFAQIVISIWSGQETAKALADLRRWRDAHLTPWQTRIESQLAKMEAVIGQHDKEIERLRDTERQ